MNPTNQNKSKISFTFLYMFLLLSSPLACDNVENITTEVASLFHFYLDSRYIKMSGFSKSGKKEIYTSTQTNSQWLFRKTEAFRTNKQEAMNDIQMFENDLNVRINKLRNKIKDLDVNTAKISNNWLAMFEGISSATNTDIANLNEINTNYHVQLRYSDIDSYLWNSVTFFFNQEFDKTDEASGRFFYPSSLISMPEWIHPLKDMDLWTIPHTQDKKKKDNFIAISAPLHPKMIQVPGGTFNNNVNLVEEYYENSNSFIYQDLNMLYFFKMIINFDVKMIVAICSDEIDLADDPRKWEEINKKINIMNKCHLYWRVNFNITFKNKKYTVSNRLLESEGNQLYKVYELKITKNGESFVRTAKVYVLSEWPDHEKLPDPMVPQMMILYDLMYKNINESGKIATEKIIIHCSAGVGRTGTTILGYQMYSQIRELVKTTEYDHSTTFNNLIKDYVISKEGQNLLNMISDEYKEDENNQTIRKGQLSTNQMIDIFTSSKIAAYVFDSILYYRCRRMMFVQTPDQFEYLMKFGRILTVGMVMEHLNPDSSTLMEDSNRHNDVVNTDFGQLMYPVFELGPNDNSDPLSCSATGSSNKVGKPVSIPKPVEDNSITCTTNKGSKPVGIPKPAGLSKSMTEETSTQKVVVLEKSKSMNSLTEGSSSTRKKLI